MAQINGKRIFLCRNCLLTLATGKAKHLCKDCNLKLFQQNPLCKECLKSVTKNDWFPVKYSETLLAALWHFDCVIPAQYLPDLHKILCDSCKKKYPHPFGKERENFDTLQKRKANKITANRYQAIKSMVAKVPHHNGTIELTLTVKEILTNAQVHPAKKSMIVLLLPDCYAHHILKDPDCLNELSTLFPATTKFQYLINRAKAYAEHPDRYRSFTADAPQLNDLLLLANDIANKRKISYFYMTPSNMDYERLEELKSAQKI